MATAPLRTPPAPLTALEAPTEGTIREISEPKVDIDAASLAVCADAEDVMVSDTLALAAGAFAVSERSADFAGLGVAAGIFGVTPVTENGPVLMPDGWPVSASIWAADACVLRFDAWVLRLDAWVLRASAWR